jgi:hypothetical protein
MCNCKRRVGCLHLSDKEDGGMSANVFYCIRRGVCVCEICAEDGRVSALV